jgi:hypothetical protein
MEFIVCTIILCHQNVELVSQSVSPRGPVGRCVDTTNTVPVSCYTSYPYTT